MSEMRYRHSYLQHPQDVIRLTELAETLRLHKSDMLALIIQSVELVDVGQGEYDLVAKVRVKRTEG
jgi:hypothetical protein